MTDAHLTELYRKNERTIAQIVSSVHGVIPEHIIIRRDNLEHIFKQRRLDIPEFSDFDLA